VRIVVTLRDGWQVSRAQDDFHGAPSRPFTWERTVEKFHWLTTPFADLRLRSAIVDAVGDLEHAPVSALTELLTAVGAGARR
jgi:2-methylcitrate dehydratase